jgi:septum formation protein
MPAMAAVPTLILASTSRYRRELLVRLGLPFEAVPPGVDESPLPGEAPRALAQRLARAKAEVVARLHPAALVIGSDQVAELDGHAIGKPGHHEAARSQLRRMSGRVVLFHTALAVQRAGPPTFAGEDICTVEVSFRHLADDEIETYLRAEQPYDCAGSAKSEGLGIVLLDGIANDDPTALIGLPLIRLARLLRAAGLDPLRAGKQ